MTDSTVPVTVTRTRDHLEVHAPLDPTWLETRAELGETNNGSDGTGLAWRRFDPHYEHRVRWHLHHIFGYEQTDLIIDPQPADGGLPAWARDILPDLAGELHASRPDDDWDGDLLTLDSDRNPEHAYYAGAWGATNMVVWRVLDSAYPLARNQSWSVTATDLLGEQGIAGIDAIITPFLAALRSHNPNRIESTTLHIADQRRHPLTEWDHLTRGITNDNHEDV